MAASLRTAPDACTDRGGCGRSNGPPRRNCQNLGKLGRDTIFVPAGGAGGEDRVPVPPRRGIRGRGTDVCSCGSGTRDLTSNTGTTSPAILCEAVV